MEKPHSLKSGQRTALLEYHRERIHSLSGPGFVGDWGQFANWIDSEVAQIRELAPEQLTPRPTVDVP